MKNYRNSQTSWLCLMFLISFIVSCNSPRDNSMQSLPREIIDLSPTITEDLPKKFWGKKMLKDFGFKDSTNFIDVAVEDPLYVVDSYIELFNHGGAHLDAPNHLDKNAMSVDQYPLKKLVGKFKVFNASGKNKSDSIGIDEIKQMSLDSSDIFIFYVNYSPPQADTDIPTYPYLSNAATEYLSNIPIKAFATDGFSVDSMVKLYENYGAGKKGYETLAPNHHSFLPKGIPVFEQLVNVDKLLNLENAIFIGLPLKIKGSNASPIRAVAFVY
jgi:kynurenine formamidase